MSEERPPRPLLATVICFYEIVVVLLALVTRSFEHWVRGAHPSHYRPTPFAQIAASEISYVLAVGAAILLWRMHRAAFYLLATRAAISLGIYVLILATGAPNLPPRQGRVLSPTTVHLITYSLGLAVVLLSTSIAWYVYGITSPKKRHREFISVRS